MPPTDAASLGCEMITVAGRITSSAIQAPDVFVIALSPRFSTIALGLWKSATTVFMSACNAVSPVR